MGDSEDILRNRVLELEKGFNETVFITQNIESDIKLAASKRRQRLHCIGNQDNLEYELLGHRVKLLRKKLDFSRIMGHMDDVRLQNILHSEQLKKLTINSCNTRDESNINSVDCKIDNDSSKENLDKIKCAIQVSVDFRLKLNEYKSNLKRELEALKLEQRQKKESLDINTQAQLHICQQRLQELKQSSQAKYKKITSDYLILRHNSRIAETSLLQSQNETKLARLTIKEKFDEMMKKIIIEKSHQDNSFQNSINQQLSYLRERVIKSEEEIEGLKMIHADLKRSKKQIIMALKKSNASYTQKYQELEENRHNEVIAITHELRRLRDMVSEVELKVIEGRPFPLDWEQELHDYSAASSGNSVHSTF